MDKLLALLIILVLLDRNYNILIDKRIISTFEAIIVPILPNKNRDAISDKYKSE